MKECKNLKALEREFEKADSACAGDTSFMAKASIFMAKTLIRTNVTLEIIEKLLEQISKQLEEIKGPKFLPMEEVIHGEKESIEEREERRKIHIEIKA